MTKQIEFGLCQCGCGQTTNIAYQAVRKRGWVRGQPMRFLIGHAGCGSRPKLTAIEIAEACERYQAGEPASALGLRYGISVQAIVQLLKRRGVPKVKQVRKPRINPIISCACGCGETLLQFDEHGRRRRFVQAHGSRRGGMYVNGAGYVLRQAPSHPKADRDGYVYEHILIAEKALGRYMPKGAEVHHVNGVKGQNRGGNLVICQNHAYHVLLHYRARLLRVAS